jgi:hypothetical protein
MGKSMPERKVDIVVCRRGKSGARGKNVKNNLK